jgi:hypothetical protein
MNTAANPPAGAERRRLSREARDAFPPMGVYAVRDRATGLVRVGASRDVHARMRRIAFELRFGGHADKELLAAWRQDPARISFEVLELVKQRADPAFDYAEELRVLEQLHRDELCGAPAR